MSGLHSMRAHSGAASADGSYAQIRCRLANLLRVSALCGGKLRGLAFVAALAAAPGIFGVSPAFAQCASGTDQSLIMGGCQASAAGSLQNIAIGPPGGFGTNASGSTTIPGVE